MLLRMRYYKVLLAMSNDFISGYSFDHCNISYIGYFQYYHVKSESEQYMNVENRQETLYL